MIGALSNSRHKQQDEPVLVDGSSCCLYLLVLTNLLPELAIVLFLNKV
jgi:hypothetical protein